MVGRKIGRIPPGADGIQGSDPCRIVRTVCWIPDTGLIGHTGRSYPAGLHSYPAGRSYPAGLIGHTDPPFLVCLRFGHPVRVDTGSFVANDRRRRLHLGCFVVRSAGRVVLVG